MTDQTTTEAHRLALSEALGLGTGAPWDAIRDRAAELRSDLETARKVERSDTERLTYLEGENARLRRAVSLPPADQTAPAVRKLHSPASDWSWKPLGCQHNGEHSAPCRGCRGECWPCPTIRALDEDSAGVLPAATDQTAVLRSAAGRAEIVGLRLRLKHDYGAANGAFEVMTELRRMADEAQPAETDTLPAWLHQRFDPRGPDWDQLDDGDRSYWEHQARAVRRVVARGGFKQPAAEAQPLKRPPMDPVHILGIEAQQDETPTADACTCGDAGECFRPTGHYADCPAAEAHACRNCEGIDPATCLMNPDRPAVGARQDGAQS